MVRFTFAIALVLSLVGDAAAGTLKHAFGEESLNLTSSTTTCSGNWCVKKQSRRSSMITRASVVLPTPHLPLLPITLVFDCCCIALLSPRFVSLSPGGCASCPCGSTAEPVSASSWCSQHSWNQANCQCIVNAESAANAHAVNQNGAGGSYDVGVWQINDFNWVRDLRRLDSCECILTFPHANPSLCISFGNCFSPARITERLQRRQRAVRAPGQLELRH